jgi:hypothetical protein
MYPNIEPIIEHFQASRKIWYIKNNKKKNVLRKNKKTQGFPR